MYVGGYIPSTLVTFYILTNFQRGLPFSKGWQMRPRKKVSSLLFLKRGGAPTSRGWIDG